MKNDSGMPDEALEKVHKVLSTGGKNDFCIDDDFLAAVEDDIGMGHTAWDTVCPKQLLAACVAVFMTRYGLKEQ